MLPRSWIDALFTKFETMYGQQFIDKWKHCDIEQVKQTWADELSGISGERIKKGLEACKESCKYAPNLPEFYQLCRDVVIYPKRPELEIEHKKTYDPDIAKSNLEKMKEMLHSSRIGSNDD